MDKFTYADYIEYKMKLSMFTFLGMILLTILGFGAYNIFTTTQKYLERFSDSPWIIVSIPTAITAWAIVGFLWGLYIIYLDGKRIG